MSLQKTCRELVLEAVLRRALAAEGGDNPMGRLQIVVDEPTMKVINSFLRMGDLHAEGVTSMELLERAREPLPDLDVLYLIRANADTIDRVLNDYRADAKQPQHRQVHFGFSRPLLAEQLDKLAGSPQLAPRVRSLVEVPLSFVTIQDRGFHFDMQDAVPKLFPYPDQELASIATSQLADVCRCLQAVGPNLSIRHAQSDLCKSVAERVKGQIELCRPSKENQVPCQLLIVDRSMDMAATLVHEYTYEAMLYDLLDGDVLDADRSIVSMKDGALGREVLLSDADALWKQLKHLHLEDVQKYVHLQVQQVMMQSRNQDMRDVSTAQMLEMVRKTPEMKEAVDRINLHLFLNSRINERMQEEQLLNVIGPLEQDIACGIDDRGKDIKASKLQEQLLVALEPRPGQPELSSEAKLRLLMLYFVSMTNIPEEVRLKLLERAKLDPDDHYCIMGMLKTKLMEVPESQRHKLDKQDKSTHRVTKEQAARFKRNARTEGTLQLSRFEPRMKELLEKLAEQRLDDADYPSLLGSDCSASASSLRTAAGSTACAQPVVPQIQGDGWSFADDAGGTGNTIDDCRENAAEVTSRLIVFVLGGITHSELRVAAEVQEELPKGTEVLVGGTALLTPKRLISTLRPTRNPFEDGEVGDDLT